MNMAEKRKHPRIDSINLSYICLDQNGEILHQAMGRTINISEGGFLLETHFRLEMTYSLQASIGLGDDTIDLRGRVVYCRSMVGGKYLAGIEITDIKDGDIDLWQKFIEKISADDEDSQGADADQ